MSGTTPFPQKKIPNRLGISSPEAYALPVALKNAGAYAQAKVEKKKKKAAADDLGPPMD